MFVLEWKKYACVKGERINKKEEALLKLEGKYACVESTIDSKRACDAVLIECK